MSICKLVSTHRVKYLSTKPRAHSRASLSSTQQIFHSLFSQNVLFINMSDVSSAQTGGCHKIGLLVGRDVPTPHVACGYLCFGWQVFCYVMGVGFGGPREPDHRAPTYQLSLKHCSGTNLTFGFCLMCVTIGCIDSHQNATTVHGT